jgi:peptidylprolyl isomerase/peptidyl-prolyl cis-trans isomerase A (cyclophilin A)
MLSLLIKLYFSEINSEDMKKAFLLSVILTFCAALSHSQTQITFYTNYGAFQAEMYDSLAPITSGNFINLVNNKRYDGKEFYRIIRNFVVQGGLWPDTAATIPDEFDSTGTLTNKKFTISMANSGPNTGSSEFFINVKNNYALDFDKAPLSSAHPVFGIVRTGWEVVDTIRRVPVNGNDQPLSPVVMDSLRVTGTYLSERELDLNAEISAIYPNPITSESILDFYSPQANEALINCINSSGQIIYQSVVSLVKGKNKIPLTNLGMGQQESGIYFVRITVEGVTQVFKLNKIN